MHEVKTLAESFPYVKSKLEEKGAADRVAEITMLPHDPGHAGLPGRPTSS